jgi:uroporphyrinogen-III synthase
MPRSSLSRPILANFFNEREIRYQACDLYDTLSQWIEPKPDLDQVNEVVFTSPSTVKAFLEIFGGLPKGIKCLAIGPVTQQALADLRNSGH